MTWRSINFDWNRARAFLVTAEEGSFSAAARALNMTQPTLGRQVSALEQELGVSLFERTARGLSLTASGHELLEQVKSMAEAAGRFSLLASSRAEELEGQVCISATEVMAAFVLPPILASLHSQAPGIQIELIASNSASDLLAREADIAIRAFRPTQADLISRRLTPIPAHLYGEKAYMRRFLRRETPQDLKGAQFLGFREGDAMLPELNKLGFGLTDRSIPLYVDHHLVQWQLVKQGLGIGFMLEQIGDMEPQVERALPNYPALEIEHFLVVHRELSTSRRLRLVFDLLAEALG
ncbi:LysR family transcriptional regulator [Aliiglaciecola sp. CAU 1673]|uniref:LysR family transcriptional regulator n=1 Tax=Aliiglaciecola sp. CAU 1673 TaxID=3032595 RepID=UPI0023DB7A19|nr:LysR family transcriptional regulator [Aliiglaciecola sp. CAU 1673]MDF2176919.1 LysR family transcriptional regulator [Aliiglaciecola sp. CAU 1673]